MARLEVISFDDGFCRNILKEFKEYASVPDDTRDDLLASLLKSAILKVQEFADTALATCTLRVTAAVPASGIIRLYCGGGEIQSVETTAGEFVRHDPLYRNRVQVYIREGEVRITYVTDFNEGDWVRFKPSVYRYATALYDGEDAQVLNSILMEAL